MTTVPTHNVVIPPGGKEGGNPAQTWWTCWFVESSGGTFALNEEFWLMQSFYFDPTSDVPNNFCPMINIHVSGTNPAFNGVAVSPVQFDVSAGTLKIYTHGGGTFDQTLNGGGGGYHDVQQNTQPGSPPVWSKGVVYDVTLHAILSPDSSVGYIQCWVEDHDGTSYKIMDSHAATFYNSDTGPLDFYSGFYTKGLPAENAQPNNDAATFKYTLGQPRRSTTYALCKAATPLGFDHARGNLTVPVFTVTTGTAYDTANFIYPAELEGGGSGTKTAGYTVKGLNPVSGGVDSNFVYGTKFTMTEDGTTTDLAAYFKGLGVSSQAYRPIIVRDSAGAPTGTVVATGAEFVVQANTDAWVNMPIVAALSSGLTYWALVWSGPTSDGAESYYDTGASTDSMFCAVTYSSTGGVTSLAAYGYEAKKSSFYVNYTPTPAPPLNTVLPAVTGTATLGNVLTTTHGTWTNNGTPVYTYQWYRDGVAIGGATAATHTVVSGDINHVLNVVVTNTDAYGAITAISNSVTPTGSPPANTIAPVIVGTNGVGLPISVGNLGSWTDDGSPTFTYQWQADAAKNGVYANIPNATASTYTVSVAYFGCNVRLRVTDTTPDGATTASSNVLPPVGITLNFLQPASLTLTRT